MRTHQLLAPIIGIGLLVGCSADTSVGSAQDTFEPDTVADVAQDAALDASEEDTAVDVQPDRQFDTGASQDTQSDTAGDTGCSSDEQCDDGNPCNGLEACDVLSGDCTPGTPPNLDDGIPCTEDSCDPGIGVVHSPKDELCSAEGACLQGVCDPSQGCTAAPLTPCCGNDLVEEGETCDDGNVTEGDGCSPKCQLTSMCDSGCTKSEDCAEGLVCEGWPKTVDGAFGQCVDMAMIDGENTPCDLNNPCPEGLACLGEYAWGGGGWCVKGWMAKTFYNAEQVAIPDGDAQGVTTAITACGLATVPVDVVVTLNIDHPKPEDLVVTLYDPAASPEEPDNGASFIVWNQTPDGASTVVAGFPGDDMVNGQWELHVQDTAAGSEGTLKGWSLYLLSNFD